MSKHEFLIGSQSVTAEVEKNADGYLVKTGESQFAIVPVADGLFSVTVDGHRKTVAAVTRNALLHFWGRYGYPDWVARRSWRGPERQITAEMIERAVEKQGRGFDG